MCTYFRMDDLFIDILNVNIFFIDIVNCKKFSSKTETEGVSLMGDLFFYWTKPSMSREPKIDSPDGPA